MGLSSTFKSLARKFVAQQRSYEQNFQSASKQAIFSRSPAGTTMFTGGGNDQVHAHYNRDGSVDVTVNGEKHQLSVEEARSTIIDLGSGNDTFTSSGTPPGGNGLTVRGQAGNDNLTGSNGADTLEGGEGNDNIWAGGGNDTVAGGGGDDFIQGGSGHDTINGDAGNDYINGGSGNDNLSGGAGIDNVQGGYGHDQVQGYQNGQHPLAAINGPTDTVNAGPQTSGPTLYPQMTNKPWDSIPSPRPPCLHH